MRQIYLRLTSLHIACQLQKSGVFHQPCTGLVIILVSYIFFSECDGGEGLVLGGGGGGGEDWPREGRGIIL